MTVAVVINPASGRVPRSGAAARAALASRILNASGARPEIAVTERRGHARELAAAAVARRVDRVLAWGGDGTVSEVASALAGTGVPLGIVPAGSGNGLARELGIPRHPDRALLLALEAEPRPIDMGEIDGRLFVNLAGIGIDAEIAARFDAAGQRRGVLGYARHAAAAILTYAAGEYVITTPARQWTERALLIAIANSAQWGNNACIAPFARPDDGQLDLVVLASRSPWSMARHVPKLFTRTIGRVRGCSMERIERVTIQAAQPIRFHVDGEPMRGGNRIEACVRAGVLDVCAPRGGEGAGRI